MDLKTSVLIVSAHGRGYWLATELQRENIPVVLIDVTPQLGAWPAEDNEGPFGFFKSEDMSDTQNERVFSEDAFENLDQGLTLWLPDGPVELKSPIGQYRLHKLDQNKEVCEALQSGKNGYKNLSGIQKWAADNFKESWIMHLAHQLAATTYVPSARASLFGKALKVMNPFLVRKSTRGGRQKSIDWLKEKNLEVYEKTEILDLSFGNKKAISGVEIHGERGSGHMRVEQLVWMLSSEESYFVTPKIAKSLFPEGALEPEWCWVRYRLKMLPCPERDCLPLHMLVLGQITSPWTHQNLMVLQRTALEDQFDAWIRIPAVQRFNKEYLRIRGEKILEILRERLSLALPEIQSYPQEFYYTYSQIGPSSFPVYGEGLESRRHKMEFNNVHVDGAEIWKNYSWDDQFESQGLIRDGLLKWWKLLQQRKEKERRD
jgi:predicted acetyltransferase